MENLIASAPIHGAGAFDIQLDTMLGFALARRAADEAEILSIAVDRSAQKQGIAGELLSQAMSELRRHGVRRLFLEVEEDNKAARSLYAKFGFAQVGIRPGYYRKSPEAAANALVLACEI